jgi:hypothetical protein
MTHASLGASKHALKFLLPAVVAAVVLALPLATPWAATPGSGTVSATNPAVTWTGAFTVATAAGCTGPGDSTCDHFSLTINPPAGQTGISTSSARTAGSPAAPGMARTSRRSSR